MKPLSRSQQRSRPLKMPVLFNSFKCTFLLIFVLPTIESIPRRSNEPWSVVLCKFAEHPDYEPRSKDWIEKWIHGHDASIESYFDLVSNGLYTIKNSNVFGWQVFIWRENSFDFLLGTNFHTHKRKYCSWPIQTAILCWEASPDST